MNSLWNHQNRHFFLYLNLMFSLTAMVCEQKYLEQSTNLSRENENPWGCKFMQPDPEQDHHSFWLYQAHVLGSALHHKNVPVQAFTHFSNFSHSAVSLSIHPACYNLKPFLGKLKMQAFPKAENPSRRINKNPTQTWGVLHTSQPRHTAASPDDDWCLTAGQIPYLGGGNEQCPQ